jgi:nicotinate-nucleotide--dimethylbenzimidazole phosphoribosyltransferase
MNPTRWQVPRPDPTAVADALHRQERLTKPPGSLGELEALALQLAGIQATPRPRSRPAAALLVAADHPVAKHGVSAYPQQVTAAMVQNFAAGGAAASVLTRHLDVPLRLLDVGVAHPYTIPAGARVAYRRAASADLPAGDIRVEDAMSEAVYAASLAEGAAEIDALGDDVRVIALGEMGIGNTTAAAAVAAALLDAPAAELVGAGTGVRGDALVRKTAVVRDAAARAGGADPHEVVRRVGGRDLAALVGAAGRAVERRIAALVDGFIVSTAMLALVRLEPAARASLVFGHRSHERGHGAVLAALDARPLLDLSLRLGEASGALAALPLLDIACALHDQMATFAEAAVPDREPER